MMTATHQARDRHFAQVLLSRRLLDAIAVVPESDDDVQYAQDLAKHMTAWQVPQDCYEIQTLGQIAQVLREMRDSGITRESIEYCLDQVFAF